MSCVRVLPLCSLSPFLPCSPCGRAYKTYCGGMPGWCSRAGRASWDPIAVIAAVEGRRAGWSLEQGRVSVSLKGTEHGMTYWEPLREGEKSSQWRLRLTSAAGLAVQGEINELIAHRPNHPRLAPAPPQTPAAMPDANAGAEPEDSSRATVEKPPK
eukprot:1795800-Prymnesium_polylepis.2